MVLSRPGIRRAAFLPGLVLAALAIGLVGASFGGAFTNHRDRRDVVENPAVLAAARGDFAAIFATEDWRSTGPFREAPYAPVADIVSALVVAASRTATWPHHAANAFLHAACAILLYAFLGGMGVRRSLAFAVAALWVVHPVPSGAAAWIGGRPYLLGAAAALAAMVAWAPRTGGWTRPWRALAAGALFSIALAADIRLAFLALLFPASTVLLREPASPRVRGFGSFAFATGAVLLPALFILQVSLVSAPPLTHPRSPMGLGATIRGDVAALGHAALGVILPVHQLPVADLPVAGKPWAFLGAAGAILLVSAATSLFATFRRGSGDPSRRVVPVLLLAGTLALVGQSRAFIPGEFTAGFGPSYLGSAFLLAAALAAIYGELSRSSTDPLQDRDLAFLALATVVAMAILGTLSVYSNGRFSDSRSLWRSVLEVDPLHPLARLRLAEERFLEGDHRESALDEMKDVAADPRVRSLGMRPWDARIGVATRLAILGRSAEAAAWLEEAAREIREARDDGSRGWDLGFLDFAAGDVEARLARIAIDEGRLEEARARLQSAARTVAEHPSVLLGQARLALAEGDLEAAVGIARQVLARRQALDSARLFLGEALAAAGRLEDSKSEYERIVEEGTDADVRATARVLLAVQLVQEAIGRAEGTFRETLARRLPATGQALALASGFRIPALAARSAIDLGLARARSLTPDDARVYPARGRELLEEALAEPVTSPIAPSLAQLVLADYAQVERKWPEAIDRLSDAIRRWPRNRDAVKKLAEIHGALAARLYARLILDFRAEFDAMYREGKPGAYPDDATLLEHVAVRNPVLEERVLHVVLPLERAFETLGSARGADIEIQRRGVASSLASMYGMLAIVLFRQQRFDDAVRANARAKDLDLENALVARFEDAYLQYQIASGELTRGETDPFHATVNQLAEAWEFDAAVAEYERFLARVSARPDLEKQLLMELGGKESEWAKRAASKQTELVARARSELSGGRPEEARRFETEARRFHTIHGKRVTEAARRFDQVLRIDGDYDEARRNLAVLYGHIQEEDRAIYHYEILKRKGRLGPDDRDSLATLYFRRATLAGVGPHPARTRDENIQDLERCIELSGQPKPDAEKILARLAGERALDLGRLLEAVGRLDRYLTFERLDSRVNHLAGRAHLAIARLQAAVEPIFSPLAPSRLPWPGGYSLDRAVELLTRAAAMARSDERPWIDLARAWRLGGQPSRAYGAYRAALEAIHEARRGEGAWGELLEPLSLAWARREAEAYIEYANAVYMRLVREAEVARGQGDLAAACRLYEEALRYNPVVSWALDGLTISLEELVESLWGRKRYGELVIRLERLLAIAPTSQAGLFIAGMYEYVHTNDVARARERFEGYLHHHPDGRYADPVRRILEQLR